MISIIIRTYNEEKFLPDLLHKISKQEVKDEVETIIVDSGSSDKTISIATQFNCRIERIQKEEFTFGKSLNLGCRAANGQLLVFISAHCIPYNNYWLEKLISPLQEESVALSYGRQIGNHLSKFSEHQVFSKYFPEDERKQQGGYFCNNANSSIKKSFWEKYNFDENLTGLEDLNWAHYFFNKGYKIVYSPESIIFHIHEESWRKVKLRYEREAYALRVIMPEIHFTFQDFLRAVMKGIYFDLILSLKRKQFWSKLLEIFLFRICQFYGAYKGNHIHRQLSKRRKQNYFYP